MCFLLKHNFGECMVPVPGLDGHLCALAAKFWLQSILTLKSYTGLQKASKRRRSAFGVHLLHEEAKEGKRKTKIHLN